MRLPLPPALAACTAWRWVAEGGSPRPTASGPQPLPRPLLTRAKLLLVPLLAVVVPLPQLLPKAPEVLLLHLWSLALLPLQLTALLALGPAPLQPAALPWVHLCLVQGSVEGLPTTRAMLPLRSDAAVAERYLLELPRPPATA